MRKRAFIVGSATLLLTSFASFAPVTQTHAASYNCVLTNDKGMAWISLYQEVNGRKGKRILDNSPFPRGSQFGIEPGMTAGNERMRYDIKWDPRDQLHGDIGFWCHHGDRIQI